MIIQKACGSVNTTVCIFFIIAIMIIRCSLARSHPEQGMLYVPNDHIVWVCWILYFHSLVCDGDTENCFYSLFFELFIMPFESQSIIYSKSKRQKRHHYHFLDKYGKTKWLAGRKKKPIFKSLLSGSRSFTFIQTHVDLWLWESWDHIRPSHGL